MDADKFVKQFLSLAFFVEKETGIFAEALLAHSALETGWGTKVRGNNYFGIKGKKNLVRTKEISESPDLKFHEIYSITPFQKNGKTYYEYDCKTWFDSYVSPKDSFLRYVEFIKSNPRYSKALTQDSAEGYLREIARARYATGFNYEETLLNVLKSVQKRINKLTVTVAQDLRK